MQLLYHPYCYSACLSWLQVIESPQQTLVFREVSERMSTPRFTHALISALDEDEKISSLSAESSRCCVGQRGLQPPRVVLLPVCLALPGVRPVSHRQRRWVRRPVVASSTVRPCLLMRSQPLVYRLHTETLIAAYGHACNCVCVETTAGIENALPSQTVRPHARLNC